MPGLFQKEGIELKRHTILRILMLVVITYAIYQQFHSTALKDTMQFNSFIQYTVKQGDTISQIAEKYKPKGENLENYINVIQFENNKQEIIYPGEKLWIPVRE